MEINPKQLILDTVHKSLIVFLENVNLDKKIKLASDLLKKFNENSQMQKINKLKSLFIMKNFKSQFIVKNKFFSTWKEMKLDFLNNDNNNQKIESNSSSNYNKTEEDFKKFYVESIVKLADNDIISNKKAKTDSLEENLEENKIEKDKESEKNQLQDSKIYNDTKNSLKKSKRIQIG